MIAYLFRIIPLYGVGGGNTPTALYVWPRTPKQGLFCTPKHTYKWKIFWRLRPRACKASIS